MAVYGFNDKKEKAALLTITSTVGSVTAGGTATKSFDLTDYGILDATKWAPISIMCGGSEQRLLSAIAVKRDTVYPYASIIQNNLTVGVFNSDDGSAQDVYLKVVLAPIE